MNPQSWPEATVVILGDLGEGRSYADFVEDIRRACPTAKIVILGESSDFAQVRAALNAGVSGYLNKDATSAGLLKSLELVMDGGIALSRETVASWVCESARPTTTSARSDVLSSRESSVLRCLLDGDSNKHIARRYAMAESTVKVHVKSIFRKIGAKNRTQAAIWAMNHADMMSDARS
jgi:two-component system nitrate/nitrite response regulator NarL